MDANAEEAKVLAGGMSLIPIMKLRLASPRIIVDINGIKDLSYIRQSKDEGLEIGALTRYSDIEDSELIKSGYPILAEASYVVADVHVRNMGTIGGALAHADPAGDVPTALLAVGAKIKAVRSAGERMFDIDDFFVGTFSTRLAHNEILTTIVLPNLPTGSGTSYVKFSRRSGDSAIVGVGVVLTFSGDGRCSSARISLASVAPTTFRAQDAEQALVDGGDLTKEIVDEAASKAASECRPMSDILGSAEYKKEMVRVFAKRAILTARDRARAMRR